MRTRTRTRTMSMCRNQDLSTQPQLRIYCNVTEALKTSNIKTMHFILRIIDEEEKLYTADAFAPIYLTLARARTHARTYARDYWNCHKYLS